MGFKYAQHVSVRSTPQTEAIPGSNQVANSAGGYSYAVDKWKRLERFLILGAEGGSYYATERKLTQENASCVLECLKEDHVRTVTTISEVSDSGRAPKNDPALFALALCCRFGDDVAKKLARAHLSTVARTGTHLLHFAAMMNEMGGWGRGTRRALASWYTDKEPADLAYQVAKYPQRDGWSHRDVLRLCHATPPDEFYSGIFSWVTKPGSVDWLDSDVAPEDPLAMLWARDVAMKLDPNVSSDLKRLVKLVTDYDLPRECLPTEALQHAAVWEALLQRMPITAMIRNLGKMTSVGILGPLSDGARKVYETLLNRAVLKKGRVHPLSLLVALNVYRRGHGDKGSLTWSPVGAISAALEDAFYLAFDAVEPTGKRHLLALDASASMTWSEIAGMAGVTPRVGSAVMSMVTVRAEKQSHVCAFTGASFGRCEIRDVSINSRTDLKNAIHAIESVPPGGTDCSLPMVYAAQNNIPVDAFVVYTDSETYAGRVHPTQALDQYRQKTGIPAKLIVVGMVSNGFTIADPKRGDMLDCVGFDTAAPAVMADFVRG